MHSTLVDKKITPRLTARLHKLENEVAHLRQTIHSIPRNDNRFDQERIEEYIDVRKKEGRKRVGLLNISMDLNIPIGKVEQIMHHLEEKGIREVD